MRYTKIVIDLLGVGECLVTWTSDILHHNIADFISNMKLMAKMWDLTKIPKCLRKRAPICRLPDILILKIHAHLPIIDQVCLALTCKTFYSLLGLKLPKYLKFPHLLRIKDPRLCVNKASIARNQLLLRLETSEWLYCGACLKLHPRILFGDPSLPSIQRRCGKNAGIVDLCPCISLTAADRREIIDLLSSTGTFDKLKASLRHHLNPWADTSTHRLLTAGRFELRKDDDGITYLTHCCRERATYWTTSLRVSLFINNGKLEAKSHYILDSRRPRRKNWLAEPVFACPHMDITLMAGYLKGERTCSECDTKVKGGSKRNENPASIFTERVLGGIGVSESSAWLRQSRFTNESYDQYFIYW